MNDSYEEEGRRKKKREKGKSLRNGGERERASKKHRQNVEMGVY